MSGLTIATSDEAWMCEACTSAGPLTSSSRVTGSSVKLFKQSFLRFRITSVTSSLPCGIAVNSCATPPIWLAVTAAPQRGEQHAAKRVAERGPKTRVQRFDVELAVVRARLELANLRCNGHLC